MPGVLTRTALYKAWNGTSKQCRHRSNAIGHPRQPPIVPGHPAGFSSPTPGPRSAETPTPTRSQRSARPGPPGAPSRIAHHNPSQSPRRQTVLLTLKKVAICREKLRSCGYRFLRRKRTVTAVSPNCPIATQNQAISRHFALWWPIGNRTDSRAKRTVSPPIRKVGPDLLRHRHSTLPPPEPSTRMPGISPLGALVPTAAEANSRSAQTTHRLRCSRPTASPASSNANREHGSGGSGPTSRTCPATGRPHSLSGACSFDTSSGQRPRRPSRAGASQPACATGGA